MKLYSFSFYLYVYDWFWILLCVWVEVEVLVSPDGYLVILSPFDEEIFLSSLNCFDTFVKINASCMCASISGLVILFHWSNCVKSYKCHTALTTEVLWQGLRSCSIIPTTLTFSFQNCLGYARLLAFPFFNKLHWGIDWNSTASLY